MSVGCSYLSFISHDIIGHVPCSIPIVIIIDSREAGFVITEAWQIISADFQINIDLYIPKRSLKANTELV